MTSSPAILRVEAPAGDSPLIARGGARFWRVNFALFLGSFATFALLYCVQPLMPTFTRAFSISPAAASLSLSAATGVLAVAMIFAGTLSDVLGRKTVMTASLAAAAAATLAASFSPNWTTFVALRALTGLALSGVPAVAMAYLVEEMDRSAIGLAMGLYIAGNTLGGMGGRLAGAALAEAGGWRGAIAIVGLVSLGCAVAFAFALPRERRLPPKTRAAALLPTIQAHFSDPGLRYLFALGFLLMGVLVTTYNYIGFRLEAASFSLSQTAIGFVYCIYLVGAVASAVMGELAGRYGRRRVIGFAIAFMPIGVLMTLPNSLWLTIVGVGVITIGFFGGHSIASSWVGLRAETAKAQASALYLFFYYAGSSLAGSIGGWVFTLGAWPGEAAFIGAMSALALAHRPEARPRAPAGASSRSLSEGGPPMEWRDEGLIIGARKHGEASTIVEALTRAHGRHLGLVRGGRSARLRATLQPGNTIGLVWRARLDEHLGSFAVEPLALRAGRLMGSGMALAGINYLAALVRVLPERDPHEALYEAASLIADALDDGALAPTLIARFEAQILAECGFRLDLSSCASTGATDRLVYVSPKSGRAVSAEAGAPWRDRLLPLPPFLREGAPLEAQPSAEEIADGFRLTGFFLARDLFALRGEPLPDSRAAFLKAAARGAR